MPIVDLQLRLRELGRIRLGQKGSKGEPQKLDRFRITSPNRGLIEQVAGLYGGTVAPWTPQGGSPQFEVVTNVTSIPVVVPPQSAYTQWMELWSGGGCVRRCDGQRDTISDVPCLCKAEGSESCKPTTRLNVMLREVAALGVWRLETHGWNAAVELPGMAEICSRVGRDLPASLTLEQRTSKSNGKTRHFMVPGLIPEITPDELVTAQPRREIEAPAVTAIEQGTDYVALVASASTDEELRGIWAMAQDRDLATDQLSEAIRQRMAALRPPE